jgi:hypothetical protein
MFAYADCCIPWYFFTSNVVSVADQEMKSILSGHALGNVVLKSQGKPMSFTVRQLLVDITADHLITKCGGR